MRLNFYPVRIATLCLCGLLDGHAVAAAPTLPASASDAAAVRYTFREVSKNLENFDNQTYNSLFGGGSSWSFANNVVQLGLGVAPYPGTNSPSLSVSILPLQGVPSGSPLPSGAFAQVKAPLPPLTEDKYYTVSMKVRGTGSVAGKLEVGIAQTAVPTNGAYIKTIPLGVDTQVQMSFVYKPYRSGSGNDGVDQPRLWIMPLTVGMSVSIDDLIIKEVDADPTTFFLPMSGRVFDSKLMGLTVNQFDVLGGAYPPLNQKILRLWDNNLYWGALEPKKGVINTETLARFDRFVNYAVAHSMDVVYTMGLPPPWATGGACTVDTAYYERGNPDAAGCGVAPVDLANWRAYIAFVAQRFKGKIKYFELWNEPDATFDGNGYQLATLAREAKSALQQADPSNAYGFKLVSPGLTLYGAHKLAEFLDAGGGNYVDIFATHSYYPVVGLETHLAAQAANFKLVLHRHGVSTSTPVWNTEGSPGCLVGPEKDRRYGPGCPASAPPTEDVQRGIQVRALTTMWLNGFSNFDYYHMVGVGGALEPWRSLANVQITPPYTYSGLTPVGQGMVKAFEWLKSAKAKAAFQMLNPKVFIVNFTNFENKDCYLVWSANELTPVTVTVPPVWTVRSVQKTDGGSFALPLSREITLQPLSPVLMKP